MEITFYGRGGQGAVTAAELLVRALSYEGKYGQCQVSYGIERRGAPVNAFLRVDDKAITVRSRIYNPDCIVVLDPRLPEAVDVTAGLKEGGTAVLNTPRKARDVDLGVRLSRVGVVDASKIAGEIYGRRPIPLTNIIMVGALIAATQLVTLPSVIEALRHRFKGSLVLSNERGATLGFESTEVAP